MDLDRRTAVLGALGLAGTALAGCTGGDGDIVRSSGTASPTPSVDARPRWPLTGRLMKTADAGQHAAVAVKVPDNENEHPQAGLDKADIVFVELDGYRDPAGYSGTRLVPLFHSRFPDDVAPVRSMRPVDVPLLSPVGALIGSTGATGWVLKYITSYAQFIEGPQITYLETKGTGSYGIDPSRVLTYQGVTYYDRAVVCHPKVLAKQSRKFRTGPSQPYFPFATTQAEISTETGQPARVVRVPWKQGHTYDMGYTWSEQAGKYLRSMPWGPHTLVGGRRVGTDNVLVVCAEQKYAKIFNGKGGPEPIHGIVDASGTFYYAHGGKYVTGTWRKGSVNQTFSFTLADGSPLKMAPGQTYVELPRANAKLRIKA